MMQFTIPAPLKAEHDDLHQTLHKATQESGDLGEAAKAVAKLLHSHFIKEEQFALPPLGLLPQLAGGALPHNVKEVLPLTDKMKAELGPMLAEHKLIVAALEKLSAAATKANKPEYAHFARALTLHAQTEEMVMYPTAILIGEFVKEKLRKP